MRNCAVKLKPLAEIDVDEIWFSIAQHNIVAADKFVDKLNEKFSLLSSFPEHGPPRSDIFRNVRVLVEGSYLVIYRFERETVEVLRVIHGARALGDLDLF